MRVRVIYGTEANQAKSRGRVGQFSDIEYASIEEAKAAPLPADAVSAYVPVEGGYYVYTKTLGWEYHEGEVLEHQAVDE